MVGESTMISAVLLLALIGAVWSESDFKGAEWEEAFASGGIHVGGGRARRFIQINTNQANTPHQPCRTPDGRPGHCRHLRYCSQQVYNNDFVKFVDYLCVIQGTSVGACCPDDASASAAEGLAGTLPAQAEPEEQNEALLKITRAENRGCGVSTRAQGRLVGARPAQARDWPWMASVVPDGFEQYCGGVLITDRHVLTAAHCTRRWKAEELFVVLGEYDLKRTNDSRTYTFKVVEKRQHQLYEHATYHHDIALLKLHRPAVFNTYVWPICLPPLGVPAANDSAIIIGWGTEFYGGPHSPVLMEVGVPVWPHSACVAAFTENVFDETVCAGGYEGDKDACQGDSGGPLMYQMASGRWAVAGVVSWGIRCGEKDHPGLYTRVDQYLQWIVENAQF